MRHWDILKVLANIIFEKLEPDFNVKFLLFPEGKPHQHAVLNRLSTLLQRLEGNKKVRMT